MSNLHQPLVSIIIPVYNAEKYLEETILSALNQTWPNKEIIIVDDGSTDNSLLIANKFTGPYIKVLRQEKMGASAARNKGLLEASGDYIQFLDADDLLSPDKIKNQVILLEQNPGKMAVCSTAHFFDGTFPINEISPFNEELYIISDNDPVHFLINLWGGYSKNGFMVTIHSWLTPKHIIAKTGLWNEELSVDDDGEFFARAVLNSKGVIKSDGISYYRKYKSQKNLSSLKSNVAVTSRFNSILSKKKLLLAVNNSFEAKASIYKALINLAADCYLQYPEIYKKSLSELPKIKLNYRPAIGGKISSIFAFIFGWKTTIYLKKIIKF